jgi:PAS domain S-box-containing protein
MRTLRIPDRIVIAGVAVALAAAMFNYLRPVANEQGLREAATSLGWTITSLLALVGSARAWRRASDALARAGWRWLTLGCAVALVARLASGYAALGGAPAGLRVLNDVLLVSVHLLLLPAAWYFLRRGERQRADLETALDTVLLTLLVAAVAIQYYVPPLARAGVPLDEYVFVVLYAASAGAIVWLVLVQLLRQTRFPREPEGLGLAGVLAYAITSLLFAVVTSPATYSGGTPLDLGWHIGLGLIAVGGALGPTGAAAAGAEPTAPPRLAPRLVVLIAAWAGIAWMITQPLLRGERAPAIALLVAAGIIALAVRSTAAFLTDRRYAARLERAVERHTRTLSESLAQTAAAERDVRHLMDAVPDAIVVLDPTGRILQVNDAGRAMVRAPAGSADPGSVFDYLDAAGAAFVRDKLSRAFAGELVSFEVPFARMDGSRGTSWVSYAPVREDGEIRKVMALARDVTDQRRTEAQLQRAERLASLGQLVSGVAHEINNPAAIISGVAQTLLLEPLSAEQREMTQTIYDEAIRIGGITTNLLTFARGSGTARTVVDVNDAVRRTLALRGFHHASEGVRVTMELDPDAPQAWANPPEVLQLLLNLVLNAEQAVARAPGERAITLRTRAQGAMVRIECADTGPGIDPEALSRVFDPFFTANSGSGTGLGLSTCYGIVRSHGGDITAESAPQRGTTFTVTLPRDAPGAAAPPPGAEPSVARRLRVLLIEDEAALRQAVERFLARRNVSVVGVADGETALAAARASEFDVVVTDVRLPGMSGKEFAERLRSEQPALGARLVVATGDARSDDARAIVDATGAIRIDKPFDLERLEEAIRASAARG